MVYRGQEGITMHGIRLWGAQIGANEHHNHQPDNSEHKKRNNNHHNRWRNENAAMPFKDGVKTDVTWENDRWKRS